MCYKPDISFVSDRGFLPKLDFDDVALMKFVINNSNDSGKRLRYDRAHQVGLGIIYRPPSMVLDSRKTKSGDKNRKKRMPICESS